MEQVYEPDWSTEVRTRYTTDIADLLVRVTPEHVSPSIQTMPLAFRPNVSGPGYVEAFTTNVLRAVAHLADLERRTGRCVTLALEPEPACFLETTEETVAWFQGHVWSADGARALARLAGVPVSRAVALARRHLGVVFDICHQTVGFEDVPASLEALVAAGVPILKLQEAAALRVPRVDAAAVEELERFTDTIYLSQTTQLHEGRLTRFLTLAEAIEAWRADPSGEREWRTHFHVPVFLDDLGAFGTTRFGIEQALDVHARTPLSDHLEIETYTWDVLPEHLKTGDVDDYVVRELEWVRGHLQAARTAGAATTGAATTGQPRRVRTRRVQPRRVRSGERAPGGQGRRRHRGRQRHGPGVRPCLRRAGRPRRRARPAPRGGRVRGRRDR